MKPPSHQPSGILVRFLLVWLAVGLFVAGFWALRHANPQPKTEQTVQARLAAPATNLPSETPMTSATKSPAVTSGVLPNNLDFQERPFPVAYESSNVQWTLADGKDTNVIRQLAHNHLEYDRMVEENSRIFRRQLVYLKETAAAVFEQAKLTGAPVQQLTSAGRGRTGTAISNRHKRGQRFQPAGDVQRTFGGQSGLASVAGVQDGREASRCFRRKKIFSWWASRASRGRSSSRRLTRTLTESGRRKPEQTDEIPDPTLKTNKFLCKTQTTRFLRNILAACCLAAALPGRGQIMSDLVCAYPPSTASAWGGEANAQVNLANGVSLEQRGERSRAEPGRGFNIVGYIMSATDSSGQDNSTVLGLVAGNAAFADVQNYKASVGADQVIFVPYASTGAAGNAYQPGQWAAISSTWWWGVVLAHEAGGHNYGRTHNDGMVTPKTIMLHNYCGGGAAWPYFYTDPNIWWNGTQMLSTLANDCSNGSLPNGGDNSSYSAQWMANQVDHIAIGPALNNVVLHWSFTNAAAVGSGGHDEL